jgi:hypothetical protein
MKPLRASFRWLLLGDILAVLAVTLIGFWTHYGEITGWRWLSTFFPVLAAWFAIAPWLGVYQAEFSRRPLQVWRPALAALLSAPLAAALRGLWLNAVITPVFVAVLAATDALGFLVWRWLWTAIARRIEHHG